MNYVYSTLTCDNAYAVYVKTHDLPIIERTILIKGGHGIANKNVMTPLGVVTEVSDEDLALLENDYHFQEHCKNKFITVDRRKMDPEKVARDMQEKDASAPITPKDYEEVPNASGNGTTYKAKSKNKNTL